VARRADIQLSAALRVDDFLTPNPRGERGFFPIPRGGGGGERERRRRRRRRK